MRPAPRTFVFLAALTGGWLLLSGCGDGGGEPSAPPADKGPKLEQVFNDHVTVETDEGVRKWVLRSRRMEEFAGQDEVLLIDLTMDFYRDDAVFSTLTADSGRAQPDSRDIHAWGNVVVQTEDGRRLETSELFYDNRTRLITNDVYDHYTWPDGEATGIGMEASPDLDYFEIKRSFNSEIHDQDPEQGGGR